MKFFGILYLYLDLVSFTAGINQSYVKPKEIGSLLVNFVYKATNLIVHDNNHLFLDTFLLCSIIISISLGLSCLCVIFSSTQFFRAGSCFSYLGCMRTYVSVFGELVHAVVLQFVLLMLFTLWSNHMILIFPISCGITYLIINFALHSSIKHCNQDIGDPLETTVLIEKRHIRRGILDVAVVHESQLSCITDWRGYLTSATAIAILGIDFPAVFEHRFAKTSLYGWSLMDMGVGFFVAAHGICSTYAKGTDIMLKKSLLTAIPLFILGCLRVFALNLAKYHHDIKEYGVHWNFFFTISLTKPYRMKREHGLRMIQTCVYVLSLVWYLSYGWSIIPSS